MPAHDPLPPYAVRVSQRARHVTLKLSAHAGLVVVVPAGFDLRRVPAIVRSRLAWVRRHMARLSAAPAAHATAAALPDRIDLPALDESWRVAYTAGAGGVRLLQREGLRLVVHGGARDHPASAAALRRWLFRRARTELTAWLQVLSGETGLAFARVVVRDQRTRWGSCSHRKTISLNYKLLFLPPPLVRHVLLHELCHTEVMDHSPRYWRLLSRLDPDCAHRRREIRAAGRHVPAWTARLAPP